MKNERFYHDDQTASQVVDAREKPAVTIAKEAVFYIGYQIKIGNAMWYHHAVILADTPKELIGGSVLLALQIQKTLGFKPIITPVFVRSLLASESDVIACSTELNIAQEIEDRIKEKHPGVFLVFGKTGVKNYTFMEVPDEDAISSIITTSTAAQEQLSATFYPIDVCQAHPVTKEFAARFTAAVSRIKALLLTPMSSCSH